MPGRDGAVTGTVGDRTVLLVVVSSGAEWMYELVTSSPGSPSHFFRVCSPCDCRGSLLRAGTGVLRLSGL